MNSFTYIQIGITIIFAIILIFLFSRFYDLSLNQYFIALVIAIVLLNAFLYFVKTITYAENGDDASPLLTSTTDILKDMTTQYELPERPGSGKAKYRMQQSSSAGCPVIAL